MARSSTPTPASGCRNFLDLPKELRRVVLQQLNPQENAGYQSCRIVNQEMRTVVQDIHLQMSIVPYWVPSAGSQIKVTDQYKAYEALYPAYHSFESRDRDALSRLLRFPYHQVREVTFNVEPPGQEPGDLMRVWNSLRWLVELWERAEHKAKRLHIVFEETQERGWTTGDKLNAALLGSLKDSFKRIKINMHIVLLPLRRIRHTAFKIHLPPSMSFKLFKFHDLATAVEQMADQAETIYRNMVFRRNRTR